jgi:anti-sigma regulatory factor (Ser/Thr protein kinase)
MDGHEPEPTPVRQEATAAAAANRMRQGPRQATRLWVPATPSAARQARRALRQLRLPGWAADDAELLVSELVTNSVRHAGLGASAHIQLSVTAAPARVKVAVRDGGRRRLAAPIPWSIRPAPAPNGAESGWGLYLVDRLASRWGTGPDGYWFELRQPQPTRR